MSTRLLLVVSCVSVLLAADQFASAQDDSSRPAAASGAGADPAKASADNDVHPNLPPGTKSVLKRPDDSVNVRAGYDGPAMVPVRPGRINDPAVQQAGGTGADATTAAANSATATKAPAESGDAAQAAAAAASELLGQGLAPPKESPLAGRPTTLLELMARVGTDRSRQLAIVRDYWKLSAAQADYNWAADELARLDQITAAKGLPVESAVLSSAQAGAHARLHEAQVGAVAAQQDLGDLLGWPSTTPLPLAGDPPLVGPYRTYFDTLFAGRIPPPRTRAIDRTLPIRLEAIQDRTLAVQAASSAIRYAEEARGKGQADLQTLLNCHAELARQRRAFLSAVRDYNLDIGEYALAVADPTLPNERLVAMLIVVKAPSPTSSVRNEPTLAPSASDDRLLQPAAPAKSAESGSSTVRRASGADDAAGNK